MHGAAMAPGFEAQHHPYAKQSSLYFKNSPNQNNSHFPSVFQTTGFQQEQGNFMNPGSSPYLQADKLDSGQNLGRANLSEHISSPIK